MSQENVEVVRRPLSVRAHAGRTLEQRLSLRWPFVADVVLRLVARLSPTSRVRQALLVRGVQDGFEAMNRGDLDVLVLGLHPDIEIRHPPALGEDGGVGLQSSYRGHAGYRKFQADWLSGWRESRLVPIELIDLGDRFVVLIETTLRGEASGMSLTQDMAICCTLDQDGKVIREQRYWDHAKALEAVGLSE